MTLSKRKIALIGPAHPYRGGIAHFTDSLADALRKRGHDISIHTFSRQYPAMLFPGRSQLEASRHETRMMADARIDSINPSTWTREARRIADMGVETVIFAYWLPFFAPAYMVMARSLRRRGIQVYAIVHNALPHKRHAGDVTLSRRFFSLCDRLIVLSSSVARDLRFLGVTTPVTQAHHPVYEHFGERLDRSDARGRLGIDNTAPTLLFFGFIRRYKGLHVLIEALPAVVRDLPSIRAIVAGEFYEHKDELFSRATALGLDNHIRFDDEYIPEEEVKTYFSAADVVVQPYTTATQSGVAQIAFHFGIPLVVTSVGALPEVVPHGEAGLIVPPENPEELAKAILTFFDDEVLRTRLADGAKSQARRYSWEGFSDIIESLPRGIRS